MVILSPTLEYLPQAPMTNTSLTAMQAMVSTPLALMSAAFSTKPGRCLASQVGVNAPGTENSTTRLPLNSSSVVIFCGPSLLMTCSEPAGNLSPTLMLIAVLLIGFSETHFLEKGLPSSTARAPGARAGSATIVRSRSASPATGRSERPNGAAYKPSPPWEYCRSRPAQTGSRRCRRYSNRECPRLLARQHRRSRAPCCACYENDSAV